MRHPRFVQAINRFYNKFPGQESYLETYIWLAVFLVFIVGFPIVAYYHVHGVI